MKMLIVVLSFALGAWMVFDGLHVLIKNKYFGPPQPGPWRIIVQVMGIDPFKLGIPFTLLGCIWIIGSIGLLSGASWSWPYCITTAILSMWYLPVGTIISVTVIATLLWNGAMF